MMTKKAYAKHGLHMQTVHVGGCPQIRLIDRNGHVILHAESMQKLHKAWHKQGQK